MKASIIQLVRTQHYLPGPGDGRGGEEGGEGGWEGVKISSTNLN